MGRVLAPLAIGAALTSLAHGIQFSKPVAGATLKAGEAIQVEWKDAGDGPPISDLKTFELFLCSGGNDPATIVSGQTWEVAISALTARLRTANSPSPLPVISRKAA